MVNARPALVDPHPHPRAGRTGRRSTLGRVHRLLSSFDHQHKRLSLSELSRRAGLPLSTTHRMVAELLDLGMLDRDENDSLCIGVDVWKLGLLTPRTHGIQRVALPYMQDLYATTGSPVHLGIQQGDEVAIVESLRPRGAGEERPRIGQHIPLHVVGVGLALLAFADPELQEHYLEGLAWQGCTGRNAPALIRRELAQVRAEGYAATDRRTTPLMSIGAPVLDRNGRPLGAISIVVPRGSARTPYGHLIMSTARAVQRSAREHGLA